MKSFVFCKQTVSRDGTVKPSRNYTIKAADDSEVSFATLNLIRHALDRVELESPDKVTDGFDVSGAGKNSPSMIVRADNGRFYCVPYDPALERVSEGGSDTESVLDVAAWMASNMKRIGKPVKGEEAVRVPDPITAYDKRCFNHISGRIEQHVASQDRNGGTKPLTILITGAPGVTEADINKIRAYAEMTGYEHIVIS